MAAKKWTVEDVLNPDSDFWIFSEEEVWDWLDSVPQKRQDEAFKNIETWIEAGDIKLEDPPIEDGHPYTFDNGKGSDKDPQEEGTKRLQDLMNSDMVNITMINNMVALSAKNLSKLKEMKDLMESHGNEMQEYRFRVNKNNEKVHTYIFIIRDN
tara:strand:+ start:124 stop:585 length:462 start_codon:yes stop_codon:yes gene_type:complete